jgi:hypothetical protein
MQQKIHTHTTQYTYYNQQHTATCFGAYCAIFGENFNVYSKLLLYGVSIWKI